MEFEEMLKKYSGLGGEVQNHGILPEMVENVTADVTRPDPDPPPWENGTRSGGRPVDRVKPGVEVMIRVGRTLRVPLDELPGAVVEDVARRLTFKNPLWIRMQRAGKLTPKITRELTCYWEGDGYLHMTRGFAGDFLRILQAHRLTGVYEDRTRRAEDVLPFRFRGELYAYEREVVEAVRARRFGTIRGQTGSGKKVIALYLAAERQVPVMVIVQTKSQAYQWLDLAGRFLGLRDEDLGMIGDGRRDRGRTFTVAISRSLHRMIDETAESVGFLVVDQCDRVYLNVFFKFVRYIPSAYMLGLALRRKRDDKLTNLMHAYMGPHLHEIDTARVYRESTLIHPEFHGRDTVFDYDYREDYQQMVAPWPWIRTGTA